MWSDFMSIKSSLLSTPFSSIFTCFIFLNFGLGFRNTYFDGQKIDVWWGSLIIRRGKIFTSFSRTSEITYYYFEFITVFQKLNRLHDESFKNGTHTCVLFNTLENIVSSVVWFDKFACLMRDIFRMPCFLNNLFLTGFRSTDILL